VSRGARARTGRRITDPELRIIHHENSSHWAARF